MPGEDTNTTDSDRSGETNIKCTLGMMQLEISTHADVDDACEEFENLWENRVEEIEESEANTLRQELEADDSSIVRLG